MYDLIIKNGTIIDGTGKKQFNADIGVKKDKIKIINKVGLRAKKVINAKGLIVAPGFIDILNHSDGYLTLLNTPTLDSMVCQGVTSIICGNCGTSLAPIASSKTFKDMKKISFDKANIILPPSDGGGIMKSVRRWANTSGVNITWITFREYLKEIKKRGISANFGSLVGYNTCRRGVIGDEIRDLTNEELKIFKSSLKDALSSGALGISLGLAYSHANKISKEEIDSIISLLKEDNKICSIHLRTEGEKIEESLVEAISFAEKNKVSVEVSHFKLAIPSLWNRIDNFLGLFKKAKSRGVDINFDFYPYERAWLALYSYIPSWISEGGREMLLNRLNDKSLRSKIIKEIDDIPWNYGDFIISQSPYNKVFVGKKIREIAKNQGKNVSEMVVELLISSNGHVICFSDGNFTSRENLKKEALNPQSIICSSGAAYDIEYRNEEQLVHPRCFGTFPRFLKEYVRDDELLSWEEAIKKITYVPAQKLGLEARGKIEKDSYADLVIIDPKAISDNATYENPFRFPDGINWVIVNGKIVVENGKHNGRLSGQILKR